MKATILALFDRISIYHTLKPFLVHHGGHEFRITDSPEFCLAHDKNRTLILVRYFLKPDVVDYDLLRRLRGKYDRVVFFNGNAGGGIHRSGVLDYVDLFYSKSLFRDRSLYQRRLYANELFTDHYHRVYGVSDEPDKTDEPMRDSAQVAKLRLGWNVGMGDFPRRKLRQRAGVFFARLLGIGWARPFIQRRPFRPRANGELFPVHARLGYPAQRSIAHHRRLIMNVIAEDQRFLTGFVSQRRFNYEVQNSKIILSPFGWGELCFRDYEAVQSGALLVKPDMSHLQTWPDIFVPGETYVPFDWDGKDLIEKCDYYLGNDAERRRIADNAYQVYREQVEKMGERFQETMREIDG